MRSNASPLKPAPESAEVMETEKLVEVKGRVPIEAFLFLEYASEWLGESVEEIVSKLICDALSCVSSYMITPFSQRWTRLFANYTLENKDYHALAALAMSFIEQYHNPRFMETIKLDEKISADILKGARTRR